jgi:pyruvate/2-oxoglutarate/acetoin dehydrogenase E1 component
MLAMDQIINIAAKAHYMYGGQVQVPLVIRAVIGKSWGQGAQHSQALQALFAHIPGLRVVMPTTPYDAKGTLIAAIRDNNPVLFLEHRTLHRQEGYVPEESYDVPLGQARVLAPGQDVTIVAISWMAVEAMRARAYLASQGISAEIVDPVTISPLDIATIRASAAKTGRVLVVDCGWVGFGVSAEIVAQLSEGRGQRPEVYRMGFEPTPCPPSPPLEHRFYPNGTSIAQFVQAGILGGDPSWAPDAPVYPEQLEFRGPF